MKIILAAVDSKYIHSNLALRYLKRHGMGDGRDIKLLETSINDDVDEFTSNIYSQKPDLVIFSVYIWNITFIEKVIKNLKKIDENLLIAMGGPEVFYDPINSMNNIPADILLEGEGEVLIEELLPALENKMNLSNVAGLYLRQESFALNSYKLNNKIDLENLIDEYKIHGLIYTGYRGQPDINYIKFPYDENDIKSLQNRLIYYEAQRGCPYRCAYCLSSVEKNLRKRDLNLVYKELDFFIENKVPLVKFVDRTFNMDIEYSYSVWSYIKQKKEELKEEMVTGFHFEVSAAILTEKQVELLLSIPKDLIQLEVGIQSTDRQVLNKVNRFDNISEILQKLQPIIDKGNVHVHTDLIAGLPLDTMETFEKSFNEAMQMKPMMLQVGFLKVLKGTEIFKKQGEYGLVFRDYPPYEIIKTRTISYDDLIKIKQIEEVVDKFWNSGKYSNFMKRLVDKYQNKWELFQKMSYKLSEVRKVKAKLKEEDYYSFSIDFIKEYHFEELAIFKDLLRFDHILKDRSGWFPNILRDEEYNSQKLVIPTKIEENKRLKGNVSRFRISVNNRNTSEYEFKETFIWYSLQSDEIYEVVPIDGGFEIKNN